ncbi:nucleotidyltransferase domain-containing protein [Desulfocucumis palustris]|uniref:nucleotidyltransferase domain-containing protein n=1 Tax=Desulfocucumis palustris TaxID=1898651 RepID=UPI000FFEA501|nr:nucleotidyltransferase family protein [Desulfocucumis palustris]
MSQAFYDAIYLFSCGVRGNKPVLIHDIDVSKIYSLAMSQGIWQTTYLALKKLYDQDELIVDKKIFDKWHQKIVIQAIKATQRNKAVNDIVRVLEQKGIKCCVLKGEVLAELYHNPICRISSDTDILIDKNLEKKTVNVLKQCLFEVEPRYPTSYHVCCYHSLAGVIELHLQLYDELFEDVWFDKKTLNIEAYRQIKTSQGNYISTLGINDGLIFITLHLIKHFLHKGVGIRQLMDVLLYMSYYKNKIDWDRYDKLLKYLKYDKFMNNAIGIGIDYLGFDKNELPKSKYNDNIMQKILIDMEMGGIYGKNEVERGEFYKIYTKERFNRFKRGNYERYINSWMRPNIIKSIFPNRINMITRYPCAKKYKLLLFIAWLHRLLNFILDVIKKKKNIKHYIEYQSPEAINDIVKKRMDLIRELDMI